MKVERLTDNLRSEWPPDREGQRVVRDWFGKELKVFKFLRRIEEHFSLSLTAIPDSALITLSRESRIVPFGFLSRWEGSIRVYQFPGDIFYRLPTRYFSVWKDPRYARVVLQAGHLKESGTLIGVYSCCRSPQNQELIEIAIMSQWPGEAESPQSQFRFRVVRVGKKEVAWQVRNPDEFSSRVRYRKPVGEEMDRLELAVNENQALVSGAPIKGSEFQLTIPLRYLPRNKK